ncbi:MAG TPA: hemerythrin domain-containing protein [Pseudonocardiaceae bacterium]|jgi:hemerythrin-like domain-containing protein|nr:hemerythrin domain-containing protein [Pseudonocardiaceae bacterium]
MSTPTTQTDLITILTDQHREVDAMFLQLENMDGASGEEAKRLTEQVVILLVQHSVAEEVHLYPATREYVPGGDEIADHELAEHEEAEQTMKRLESLTAEDADFWPTVHELIGEVRHHVQEEENNLFPKLRAACTAEQLQELGQKVERTEKVAPTRPHPSAPSEGALLGVLAPGVGLVDRLRDALSGRGR